jgi:hypothetical protein
MVLVWEKSRVCSVTAMSSAEMFTVLHNDVNTNFKITAGRSIAASYSSFRHRPLFALEIASFWDEAWV